MSDKERHVCIQEGRFTKLESKITDLWRKLDDFLTIKIFALFMSTFMAIMVTAFGFVYASNAKIFDMVTTMNYTVTQLKIRTERESEVIRLNLRVERAESLLKAARYKAGIQNNKNTSKVAEADK